MIFIIILNLFVINQCLPISKVNFFDNQTNISQNKQFNKFITAELKYLSSQTNQSIKLPIVKPSNVSNDHSSQNRTQFTLNYSINFLKTTKPNKNIEYKLPIINLNSIWQNQMKSDSDSESDYSSESHYYFSSYDHDEKFNNYYMEMQYLVGDLVQKFNLYPEEIYKLFKDFEFNDSDIVGEDYQVDDLVHILSKLVQTEVDFDYIINYKHAISNKKIKEKFIKFYEKFVIKNYNKLKILIQKIKNDIIYYGY